MFKKAVITVFSMAVMLPVLANDCDTNITARKLLASYQTSNKAETKRVQNWQYIRQADKVIFYYPQRNIAEQWSKDRHQKVIFERWFVSAKRVIQYNNSDLKSINNDKHWSDVGHVLQPEALKTLKKTGDSKYACWAQENYSGKQGGATVHVEWLPQLQLLKKITLTQNKQSKTIQLERLEALGAANTMLKARETYDEMDFADIGDNETDPFISNMIEQGFGVERDPGMYPEQHGHGGHKH